jgi:hypothetical protein
MRNVICVQQMYSIRPVKRSFEKDWVLGEFKIGRSPLLVATDVASRGLGVFYSYLNLKEKSASRLIVLSHLHVIISGYARQTSSLRLERRNVSQYQSSAFNGLFKACIQRQMDILYVQMTLKVT